MMQFAHAYLKDIDGLRFYRLLGTGAGNGFHWSSDFSTYALLTVWDIEADADTFIAETGLYAQYREKSSEQFTVFMVPVRSHGMWSGQNPFIPVETAESQGKQNDGITAVITRATIANRQLLRFWKYVPGTSGSLDRFDGLIYAKGVGEWPIKQMATFSLWENLQSMQAFAYRNEDHRIAIQKTRELNWYNEELFARFRPFKSEGTWGGKKLLPF